jgi:2-oxoglutarate ferredoxin oxidoreductase subunit beta
VKALMEAHDRNEVLTGVFYIDTEKPNFTDLLNLADDPLATLPQERTRPSRQVLAEIMSKLA